MSRVRLGIALAVVAGVLVTVLVLVGLSFVPSAPGTPGRPSAEREAPEASGPDVARPGVTAEPADEVARSEPEREARAETAEDAVQWLVATEHLFAQDCAPEDGLAGSWDALSQAAPAEEAGRGVRIYRTEPSGRRVLATPVGPVVLTWADGRCDAVPVEASTVRGEVEGPGGEPAARARVQVCRATAWTDEAGIFEVEVHPDRTAMVQEGGALWCTIQAEHPELGRSSAAADPVVLGEDVVVRLALDGRPPLVQDLYDQADVVAEAALDAELDSQTRAELAVIGQWVDGAPEGVQPGLEALARSREARDGLGDFQEDQALDILEERAEALDEAGG